MNDYYEILTVQDDDQFLNDVDSGDTEDTSEQTLNMNLTWNQIDYFMTFSQDYRTELSNGERLNSYQCYNVNNLTTGESGFICNIGTSLNETKKHNVFAKTISIVSGDTLEYFITDNYDLGRVPYRDLCLMISCGHDSDGDTLSDELEATLGTDPNMVDTDGDGVNDREELQNGTDPTVADDGADITSGVNLDNNYGSSAESHLVYNTDNIYFHYNFHYNMDFHQSKPYLSPRKNLNFHS